jgi:hypothetical protein
VLHWCCEEHDNKEITMNLDAHLQELRKKHEALSTQVEKAQSSPSMDDLDVVAMKKEKLRLKEEIERLSGA